MKPYVYNPRIYQHHCHSQVGSALPGFVGVRVHRNQEGDDIGTALAKLARKAIPLLMSGAKLAKPHDMKAAKGIAKYVTHKEAHEATTSLFNKNDKQHLSEAARKPSQQHLKIYLYKDVTYSRVFLRMYPFTLGMVSRSAYTNGGGENV